MLRRPFLARKTVFSASRDGSNRLLDGSKARSVEIVTSALGQGSDSTLSRQENRASMASAERLVSGQQESEQALRVREVNCTQGLQLAKAVFSGGRSLMHHQARQLDDPKSLALCVTSPLSSHVTHLGG